MSAFKLYGTADALPAQSCDTWRDEVVSVILSKDFLPSAPGKVQITAPTGGCWYRINFLDAPTFLAAAGTATLYFTGATGNRFDFYLKSVDASRSIVLTAV